MTAIDPDHYTATKVEPINVIEAWGLCFHLGNAVKYIARAGRKGCRREDLIKAANYCYRAATGEWLPKELLNGHDHQGLRLQGREAGEAPAPQERQPEDRRPETPAPSL